MIVSTAMSLLSWGVISAQPFQAFGGETGVAHNFRITIDVTDAVTPLPTTTNQALATSPVPPAQKVVEQPTLPSAEEIATPKALAEYFCRMWRDENYEAMYYCMSKGYRRKVRFIKFAALFTSDAERTGGLDSGVVVAEYPDNIAGPLLLIDLKFMKKKVPTRRVKALFEKTKDGYRLVDSGILPLDFNNL